VLAILEVPLDDLAERRVSQESVEESREEGREARDAGREDESTGAEDAARLAEGLEARGPLRQVVERPEQEHRVHRPVGLLEAAGVADPRVDSLARARRGVPGLRHVERDRVDQDDAIAAAGEPHGVRAGTAAHVEDTRGRVRQPALEDLARPRALDHAVAFTEARRLAAAGVVGEGLGRERSGGLVHDGECIVAGQEPRNPAR
jgi:hypothetical protein